MQVNTSYEVLKIHGVYQRIHMSYLALYKILAYNMGTMLMWLQWCHCDIPDRG